MVGIVKDYERMCSDIGKSLEGFLQSCPSDVILLVGEKRFQVHKFVFSARSKYFDTLFSNKNDRGGADVGSKITEIGSRETDDVSVSFTNNIIEIRNAKLEVVKGILTYFYEGHYDCHDRIETHLLSLELARLFLLNGLEGILIEHLVKSITLKNLVDIFYPFILARNDKLGRECINFFKVNLEKIIANGNFSKFIGADTHLKALELAFQYNLGSLENIQVDILVKSITMSNFTDFFNLNTSYKNAKLKKICDDFLEKYSEEITSSLIIHELTIDSLLSLLNAESFGAEEIYIFRSAERWAAVNKPNEETVKEIVKRVRLATMSQEDLILVVKRSKDLPSIDIKDALKSARSKDAASNNFRSQRRKCNAQLITPNKALRSKGAIVTGGRSDPMNCLNGREDSGTILRVNYPPLIITLEHPYWLSSIRILINALGNNYTIESSPDGESWEPVAEETKWCTFRVWRNYEFSCRIVKHFRVTMKKMDVNNYQVRLYQFETTDSTITGTK